MSQVKHAVENWWNVEHQRTRITHQAFLHREGRTAGMHSISTALLCLHGASNERGRDNRIRRSYWRKINLKLTALCGKSPQEINNIVHKVNDAGRIRLLKLNARKTKLMVVGDDNANVSIDIDGETIAKVNSFKYIGTIKTSTGSCSEDTKARIGRAKKATMELDTIWKDRGI